MTADLLVVGTGLIGTSVGLALAGSRDVVLADARPEHLAEAVRRRAGRAWDGTEDVRHVLVAVPPRATPAALRDLAQRLPAATLSHVASVQAPVEREVADLGERFCGSHPLSGRESAGPGAASAELFAGRPWVLCPTPATGPAALAAARAVAEDCGAEVLELTAAEHDRAVALTSHLPQVAASALAARLRHTGEGDLRLAGPGLQDTTRIAASDPGLWLDVLGANAAEVAPLVRALADHLAEVADALTDPGGAAVLRALLEEGNVGRALVPRKRGERDGSFVPVRVAVPDRPGQLAGVLVAAAEAGVNVEDVRVEHLGGRPRGVIELLVHADGAEDARRALGAAGWDVLAG